MFWIQYSRLKVLDTVQTAHVSENSTQSQLRVMDTVNQLKVLDIVQLAQGSGYSTKSQFKVLDTVHRVSAGFWI